MSEMSTAESHAYVAGEAVRRARVRFRLRLAALLVAIAPLALPFPLAVRFYFQTLTGTGAMLFGPGADLAGALIARVWAAITISALLALPVIMSGCIVLLSIYLAHRRGAAQAPRATIWLAAAFALAPVWLINWIFTAGFSFSAEGLATTLSIIIVSTLLSSILAALALHVLAVRSYRLRPYSLTASAPIRPLSLAGITLLAASVAAAVGFWALSLLLPEFNNDALSWLELVWLPLPIPSTLLVWGVLHYLSANPGGPISRLGRFLEARAVCGVISAAIMLTAYGLIAIFLQLGGLTLLMIYFLPVSLVLSIMLLPLTLMASDAYLLWRVHHRALAAHA